jgi:hypothetical protein
MGSGLAAIDASGRTGLALTVLPAALALRFILRLADERRFDAVRDRFPQDVRYGCKCRKCGTYPQIRVADLIGKEE